MAWNKAKVACSAFGIASRRMWRYRHRRVETIAGYDSGHAQLRAAIRTSVLALTPILAR